MDFDLTLPPGPVSFDASLGLKGLFSLEALYDQVWNGRHHVAISVEGGPFQTLRTARMADRPENHWLRWRDLTVDLSRYAGRRVTLRLEVLAESPFKESQIAWWGSPRLIESSLSRQP